MLVLGEKSGEGQYWMERGQQRLVGKLVMSAFQRAQEWPEFRHATLVLCFIRARLIEGPY